MKLRYQTNKPMRQIMAKHKSYEPKCGTRLQRRNKNKLQLVKKIRQAKHLPFVSTDELVGKISLADVNIVKAGKDNQNQRKGSCKGLEKRLRFKSEIFILLTMLNIMTVTQTIGTSEGFIKVTTFQVPLQARLGETVRLVCIYELGSETLRAMKLFKDGQEFYRFAPAMKRDEQRMKFHVQGIEVDERRSNEREVYLRPISRRASGRFKCQVSVENTYRSVSAERQMEVIERNRTQALGSSAGQQQQQQQLAAPGAKRHTVQNKQLYDSLASMSSQQQQQQPQNKQSSIRNRATLAPYRWTILGAIQLALTPLLCYKLLWPNSAR